MERLDREANDALRWLSSEPPDGKTPEERVAAHFARWCDPTGADYALEQPLKPSPPPPGVPVAERYRREIVRWCKARSGYTPIGLEGECHLPVWRRESRAYFAENPKAAAAYAALADK